MILNQLDLGAPSHPWAAPVLGQVVGTLTVEGIDTIVWPRGSIERKQTVSFWVKAWQAIGGQSANSQGATKYLLKQLEELASNRAAQPVYIQWTATADPAASYNATELHDGWYVIDDFEPNYGQNVVTGLVQCTMTVTQIAAQAPRRMVVSYIGGALSSTFSGQAFNQIALPVGATDASITFASYTGGDGVVPTIVSPTSSPQPFTPSATLANYFKGGVRVYDTINTGSNPVPTAASGTYVNTNWVEVLFTDHDFQGDCVITNGLHLYLLQAGQAQIATAYLWNTAAANVGWQQFGTLNLNAGASSLQSYALLLIAPSEVAASLFVTNANGDFVYTLRLQSGRFESRFALQPLTGSWGGDGIEIALPSASKIAYTSTNAVDTTLDSSPVTPTDYGYGAIVIPSTSFPFICGLLIQNQSAGTSGLPLINSTTNLGPSGAVVAQNSITQYGVFAAPFGVNGSYSTANLQAEGESGALGTGWSNAVDAGASAGHTAKATSGTASGNADLFGTAFSPPSGHYDVWFRVKVTSNGSSSAEMTLGLWDNTAGAFVASTTLNRNAMTTSYAWYRVATNVVLPATHATQFRAVTALTLTTDWFIDEAVLTVKNLSGTVNGPQDIWQHFMYDRSTKVIRA